MSTTQQAINDKKALDVAILDLIIEYQQKHPGLIVESVIVTTTKVSGHPPVQTIESVIKIS
jgi:hypothetical protein